MASLAGAAILLRAFTFFHRHLLLRGVVCVPVRTKGVSPQNDEGPEVRGLRAFLLFSGA
jgi:hypothetical protein